MVLYKAKSLFGLDNAALASLNCVCHLFCLELFSRLKDKKAANDERIIYLAAVNCLYYSILENTGRGFTVDHCETVYYKNTPFYIWAIVRETNGI